MRQRHFGACGAEKSSRFFSQFVKLSRIRKDPASMGLPERIFSFASGSGCTRISSAVAIGEGIADRSISPNMLLSAMELLPNRVRYECGGIDDDVADFFAMPGVGHVCHAVAGLDDRGIAEFLPRSIFQNQRRFPQLAIL